MAALKRQALFWAVVVFSVLITTADIVRVKRPPKKNRYCDQNKHKYYHKQWGRCKRCDRCPIGYGQEDEDVPMDPLHGAMGCKRCRRCVHGITFNNRDSFKSCQKCRNCTVTGQTEQQTCTVKQNTKCIPISKAEKHVAKINTTQSESVRHQEKGNTDNKDPTVKEIKPYFWITSAIVVVSVMIFLVSFRGKIAYCVSHGRSGRMDIQEMNNMTVGLTEDNARPLNNVMVLPMERPTDRTAKNGFAVSQENDLDTDAQLEDLPKSYEATTLIDGSYTGFDIEEGTVTQKQMLRIAMELAKYNKVFALGAALDIDHSTVELIEDENETPDKVLFKLLVKWGHLMGKRATKRVLSEALITIGCPNLNYILRD